MNPDSEHRPPTELPSEFLTRYSHKLVSAQGLRERLGAPPRVERLVMCHGVFDIVHPGHVRHLLYARSKGDLLVASLTSDRHIVKGTYRPHVPEGIRAANLAAFEFVDFVIIDEEETPIRNLRLLQPEIFAKGYEYSPSADANPRTYEEIEVVESYGGLVLFTPGDVVFSSTALLQASPPRLNREKLAHVMLSRGLSTDELHRTLDSFSSARVHVVGDTIVDSLSYCDMLGGQSKTPTMSVVLRDRVDAIGGAAIVALHLKEAGADVQITTVLGDDELGAWVRAQLVSKGVEVNAVVDGRRPTTHKNAVVAGGYRLLKVDTVDNSSISDRQLREVTDALSATRAEAVVFSDFRHGIFNRRTIPALVSSIPSSAMRVGDSQVASRWGNVLDFRGFDLVTPNEREARFALADQDVHVRQLASTLYDQCGCQCLILKLGERGVYVVEDDDHTSSRSYFVLDSFVEKCIDAVGAGDALLAYATLGFLTTRSAAQAAILGSMAAACECEIDGNTPIPMPAVRARLDRFCAEAEH